MPTALDEPAYVAMMALTKRDGFASRKVYFNPYEMLKILRWQIDGKHYDRLALALKRLHGISIHVNYLWDRGEFKKCIGEEGFHIIDKFLIAKGKKSSQSSYFQWGEDVFESFVHGNLKDLNLDTYFSLKSSISKRFYRLWDKRLYCKNQASFDLKELAYEKLGISRNLKYPSLLKQALNPALREHRAKGLLASASYTKGKSGDWFLNIRRCKDDPEPSPTSGSAGGKIDNSLVAQLVGLGISQKVAEGIVSLTDPQVIKDQIEALPYRKNIEDKPAFLIKAIEENYPLPEIIRERRESEKRKAEESLKKEYNKFILAQVDEYLKTLPDAQIEQELKAHEEIFYQKYPHYEEFRGGEGIKVYIRFDYKIEKSKILNLPTLEQWQSK